MKRSLIYILVAIVVAGWIGTLMARDPGYVLISYDGATLETGLWVMLAALLIIVALTHYTLRFLGVLRGTTGAWQGWRENRKLNRSQTLTGKGISCYQAGENERAERFLLQGIDAGDRAATSYIFAARAANALGNTERRDSLLRDAVELDSSAKQAAAIARAEMLLDAGEWQACLETLHDCDDNDTVLKLKKKALFELKDWQGLIELMPLLRKTAFDDNEILEFEKRIALARLSEDMTTEARKVVYKQLPKVLKKDTDIILEYCKHLQDEAEAEKLLRSALKSGWEPELVIVYGELGTATLAKRIKTARSWLKDHADDYALQLCLGELYRLDGDSAQARGCYEKSLDIKPTSQASARLGEILSFEGDQVKSNEYFRQALKLI